MTAKLLATTAVALLLAAGPSFAANTAMTTTPAGDLLATGFTMPATDVPASKVLGAKVFDKTGQGAQQIGKINDLVLDQQGRISAAVVGVGGFLGVGEKNVAVDYGQLVWSTNADGSWGAVLNTTKDALNSAPAFTYPDNANQTAAATSANTAAVAQPMAGATSETSNSGVAATANAPTPDVDVSTLKPIDMASMKSDDLKGIDVISTAGNKLGSINDFVLTTGSSKVDAVVVDFGGFLGIGTKQVAVGYDNLKFMTDANNKRYLELNVTKDQLNAQQAYNKDTYTTDRDQQRMKAS